MPPDVGPTDNEIAGLAKASTPLILTWDRAYALVLVRARSTNRVLLQTVDLETLARESDRFGVADFARFRTQFLTSDVVRDPGPIVLSLLGKLQAIANAHRSLTFYESLRKMLQEQVQGSSGLNRQDLDAVFAISIRNRDRLDRRTREFRDGLDELKVVLGLSPRAAVVLDRKSIEDFEAVFVDVESWARNTNRRLTELYRLFSGLPEIGDMLLDGTPVLQSIAVNSERLEEYLTWAAELSVANRRGLARFRPQENIGVSLELKIRRRIRELAGTRRAYGEAARTYELAVRLRDQSFERLHAPTPENPASRSPWLERLLAHVNDVVDAEDNLVDLWTTFRAERLRLYKDLGVLPYNDWASFYSDLTARRTVVAGLP